MISLVYHYYIKLDFSLNISINKFIIWFEVLSVRCTKGQSECGCDCAGLEL